MKIFNKQNQNKFKCTFQLNDTIKDKDIDKIINKNMDLILEIFEFKLNKLENKFINKVIINNLYNSECIMCLEIKPESNNYFQCKNCINKFICYECFNQLQQSNRLNNKCLICYQNYF